MLVEDILSRGRLLLGPGPQRVLGFLVCLSVLVLGVLPLHAQSNDVAASERLFRQCVAERTAAACDTIVSKYSGWTQTPRWALARVHVQRALFLERDGDFIGAYKELQTAQTVKFSRDARRFMARLEKKMSQTRRDAGDAGTGNKGRIATAPPPSSSASSERAEQIVQRAKRAESRKTTQVVRKAPTATRPTKVPLPISRMAALGPAKKTAPKSVVSAPAAARGRVADPQVVRQNSPGDSTAGISDPVPDVVLPETGVEQAAASKAVIAKVRKGASEPPVRVSQEDRPPSLAMSDWIDIMGRSAAGAGLVTETGRVVADGDRRGLPVAVSSVQSGSAETAAPASPLRVTSEPGQRRVVWSLDSHADRCGVQGPDGVRAGGLSGTIAVDRPARGGLYRLQCFKDKRLVTDVAVTAPFTPSASALSKRAVEPAPDAQIEATQVANGAAVVSSPSIMPSTGQPVVAMIDQVDAQCKRTLERSKPSDRRVRMSAGDDDYSVVGGMTLSWVAGPLLSDCRAGAEGSLKPVSNRGTLKGVPIGGVDRTYRIVCRLCDGATRSAQVSGTALKGKAIVAIRPLPRVDPFEPRGRNWFVPVLATVFGMGVLAIALRRREETVETPAVPEKKTFAAGSRPKPVIDDAPALRPLFVRVSEVPLEKIPPMPSDEELAREDLAAKRAQLPDLASPEGGSEQVPVAIPDVDEVVEPTPDEGGDPGEGAGEGRPALYSDVSRGAKQVLKGEWRNQYQASKPVAEPDGADDHAPVEAIAAESENQLSDVMDDQNRAPITDEAEEAAQPAAPSEASPEADIDFLDDPSLFDGHETSSREVDVEADLVGHASLNDGMSIDRVTDDTAMSDILVEPTAFSRTLDETVSLKDLQDHAIEEDDKLPEHEPHGAAPEVAPVPSRPLETVQQETPLPEPVSAPEPVSVSESGPLPVSDPEPLPRLTDDEAHGLIAVLRDGGSLRGQSAKGGSVGLVADLLMVSQRAEQADGEPVSYDAFLRLFGVGELAAALSHESVQITDEPSGFDLASLANAIERSHITAQSAAFADAFALLVCQRVLVGASLPVSESVHRTLFSSVRELLWEEPSMRFATGGFGAAKTIIRASRQAHGRDRQPGDDEDLHMAVRSVTSFAEMFDIELVRFGTAVEGLLSTILQPVQGRSMALGDGSLVCPVPLTYLASDSQRYLRSVVRTLFADGAKLASPLLATKRVVRKRIETAGVGRPISGRADLLTIEHFDDTALGQLLLVPFDMPLALLATQPVVWVADAVAAQRSDIMRDLVSGGADAETHAFVWDQGGDLAAAMAAKRSVELIGLDRADGASAGGLMNFLTLHRGFVPGGSAEPIDPGLFAAIYGELLQAALVGHGHPPHLTKHQRAMLHVCLRLVAQCESPTIAGLVTLLNGKPNKRSFRPDATAALATDVKRLKACFKGVPRTERIALTSRLEGLFRQPLFAELFNVDGGQTFSNLIAAKSIVVFEDPDAGTDFRRFGLILSRMISRRHPAGIDVRESSGVEVPTVRDGWDGRLPAYHGRLVVGVAQLTGAEDEQRDLVIAHGSLPEGASGDSNVSGHRAMAVSHIRDPETGNWLPLYRNAR